MLTRVLAQNLAPVLAVWVIVYVTDYYLTIIGAKLYRSGAHHKLIIEGSYELTPVFQKDVDRLRLFSPQFWARLLVSIPLLILIWLLAVPQADMPELFAIGSGALLLREVPVLMRHARNLYLFRHMVDSNALQGQMTYARWFTLRSSAFELWQFSGLFVVIAVLVQEWFFIGGAVGCAIEASRHWRLAAALPRR